MTSQEILALRDARGWVSPLAPIEHGEQVLMFSQRGTYEWMMHPDDALMAVLDGMVVDGLTLKCTVVDCFPLMNAFMIRAKDPESNTQFVPPEEAKAA